MIGSSSTLEILFDKPRMSLACAVSAHEAGQAVGQGRLDVLDFLDNFA